MDDLLVALRAVVALAAVLGLLLFLSRRLQKSQAKGANPLAGLVPKKLGRLTTLFPTRTASAPRVRPEKITVVARSGLGGKTQLVVAEFGGIRYVLGVTEHGVSVVDTQEAPSPTDAHGIERDVKDDAVPGEPETGGRSLKSVA